MQVASDDEHDEPAPITLAVSERPAALWWPSEAALEPSFTRESSPTCVSDRLLRLLWPLVFTANADAVDTQRSLAAVKLVHGIEKFDLRWFCSSGRVRVSESLFYNCFSIVDVCICHTPVIFTTSISSRSFACQMRFAYCLVTLCQRHSRHFPPAPVRCRPVRGFSVLCGPLTPMTHTPQQIPLPLLPLLPLMLAY